MKCLLLAIFLIFSLTGCWDGVELENRAFTAALGIDAKDGQFEFAVICARSESDMDDMDTDDDEEEDGGEAAKSTPTQLAKGRRLIEAIHGLDAESSRKLFLGQTQTAVFGKSLLENEKMFREALNLLESRPDIQRGINILATTASVTDILSLSPPGESKPGYYAVNFYEIAKKSGGRSFQQNLEPMMASLRESGAALLPMIEDDGTVAGAVVVKDYRLSGELGGSELRGLLWGKSRTCLGAIIAEERRNIPLTVRRHRSNFHFSEAGGILRVIIDVRIKGEVSGFWGEAPPALEYEQLIAGEMQASIHKIQHELKADALGLRRALQKQQHALYLRYAGTAERWEQTFAQMQIVPRVRCDVQVRK